MKARLRMIRHGEAMHSRNGETDPGLSLLGVRQALGLPALVTDKPERLLTSPLIRARETALPLADSFGLERNTDADFAELPWRPGQAAAERMAELNVSLHGSWAEFDDQWRNWRRRIIERAMSETGDVVIVSHFVVINVLAGYARGDDRAVIVRPANASITEFHVSSDGLSLVSLGVETTASPDPHLALAQGFPS